MVNEKQKRVIAFLRNQLDLFESTGDIFSPTHMCEIQAYSSTLEPVLHPLEVNETEEVALSMYFLVRELGYLPS